MTAVGGDAFDVIPGGCDTYLLVNVLHDWSDADATRLLGAVATAMGGHEAERNRLDRSLGLPSGGVAHLLRPAGAG